MLQQAQIAGAFLFGDGAFAQIGFVKIGADQIGAAQATRRADRRAACWRR